NGQGAFLLTSGGGAIAGSLSGNVSVNIPGLSFNRPGTLQINTGASASLATAVTIAGQNITIPSVTADEIRLGGTGRSLSIGGLSLSGEMWFTQTTSGTTRTTTLTFTNVTLFLGDDGGTPSNTSDDRGVSVTVNGDVELLATGVAANLTGTISLLPSTLSSVF